MRIGTWNLAGRWSTDHAALLREAACDVWLLTEVDERTDLPGFELHRSTAEMASGRRWAAVASRRALTPEPDPHPASARTRIGAVTFVSSVLPWRACGSGAPWVGDSHAARTAHAVAAIELGLRNAEPLVWGGDWNHALSGKEYAGSRAGRSALLAALDALGLEAATADLPHVLDGLLSIDHVAVPRGLAAAAERVSAEVDGRRLSDHDAYVVEVDF